MKVFSFHLSTAGKRSTDNRGEGRRNPENAVGASRVQPPLPTRRSTATTLVAAVAPSSRRSPSLPSPFHSFLSPRKTHRTTRYHRHTCCLVADTREDMISLRRGRPSDANVSRRGRDDRHSLSLSNSPTPPPTPSTIPTTPSCSRSTPAHRPSCHLPPLSRHARRFSRARYFPSTLFPQHSRERLTQSTSLSSVP